jgi:DNA segregation ATPase FtsK/SpoIIIE-like protein
MDRRCDERLFFKVNVSGMIVSYDFAVLCVLRHHNRRTSTSHLQRWLSIGYNRCALWLFWMEAEGIVSPIGEDYRRDVLAWLQ